MYRIEICKSKTAYKIVPITKVRLDIEALKKAYPVKIDAGIALVIHVNGVDVTVHSFGEVQFTKMCAKNIVEKIAEKIYRHKIGSS